LVRGRKDDIGPCSDNFSGELRKAIKPPLGRVPVYDEIDTLDIADTFHLLKE
jgi:hypothetical protein